MATAIKDEGDGMLFLMDEYLGEAMPMNRNGRTDGGYEKSDMREFLQEIEKKFPKNIKQCMATFENGDMLRLLTITEMCGVDKIFESREGQIEWMKDRIHRIADRKGEKYECGWTSTIVSDTDFAFVDWYGDASRNNASDPHGVRPAFKIIYP